VKALNEVLALLVFFLGIISVVILTSKFKVQPYFALFSVAIIVGLITGIPMESIGGIITEGFSKTLGYTTIITVSAIIIGEIMKETGAIYVISKAILNAVGKKNSHYAIGIAGYVVAFPVLCGDTAFILLSPLAESLGASGALNPMNIILALAAGSFASYALLFPAAPLLPVTILEADVASSLILGLFASIPALILGLILAGRLGKGFKFEVKETKTLDELASKYGVLPHPGLVASILTVPILLIVGRSLVSNLLGTSIPLLEFLGNPVIALPIGVGLSLLLARGKPVDEVNEWISNGVKNSASVLMIVGAGSVLGIVLQQTGVGTFLGNLAMGANLPSLLVVFLIAAIMKTGQGGTTTTMITATSIVLPLIPSLGINPVMAAMTICAGAMIVVHVNDSLFWVVTGFSKMDVASGYRTLSILSVVMGVTAFLVISLVGPTILGLV
jgi:GntP family gluconate:H+ symporter